jgi:hypothetical protein
MTVASGEAPNIVIRCLSDAGSGFRGNSPSPPMVAAIKVARPRDSRSRRLGASGLFVRTEMTASDDSSSSASGMPS